MEERLRTDAVSRACFFFDTIEPQLELSCREECFKGGWYCSLPTLLVSIAGMARPFLPILVLSYKERAMPAMKTLAELWW